MRFIDMDGVIVDFILGLELVTHVEHDYSTYQLCPRHQHFVDKAPAEFWENLEPTPWYKELVIDSDIILTRCVSTEAARGKARWLKNYLPLNRFVLTDISKQHLASKNNILIDDSEVEIMGWVAAGGKGVLFPQHYNTSRLTLEQILKGDY